MKLRRTKNCASFFWATLYIAYFTQITKHFVLQCVLVGNADVSSLLINPFSLLFVYSAHDIANELELCAAAPPPPTFC